VIPANLAAPGIIPEERIDLFLHEPLPFDPVDSVADALPAMNPLLDGGHFNEGSC
jgi:hypothetical protein